MNVRVEIPCRVEAVGGRDGSKIVVTVPVPAGMEHEVQRIMANVSRIVEGSDFYAGTYDPFWRERR